MNKKWKWAMVPAFLLLLTGWTLWGNKALEINEYKIKSSRIPEEFSGFRIAQISDLHNDEFGEGNEKLLRKLALRQICQSSSLCDKPSDLPLIHCRSLHFSLHHQYSREAEYNQHTRG